MPCKISLSDIDKMSTDFDNLIQQERETDVSAITELKEYVKSKLDESCEQAKSEIYSRPINVPVNLGFIPTLDYIWKKQTVNELKLEYSLKESKARVSNLDVEDVLEALRINYRSGFTPAFQYILNQPITITPKPYSEMSKNNSIL